MHQDLLVKLSRPSDSYIIKIGQGLLTHTGTALHSVRKAAIVSDSRVFSLYGAKVVSSLDSKGIEHSVILISRGESAKSLRTLEKVLAGLSTCGISRRDAVVALGGGVVGDVAGLAASLHLRGIRYLQAPTTLLSIIDSSVGGKTGINTPFGKNLVGTFHQPMGVLADTETLASLPRREIMAGFMEAIKHGALSSREHLAKTGELGDVFRSDGPRIFTNSALSETIVNSLAEHIRFKLTVVRTDEREDPGVTGPRSRKILNFGHTFGHALEKVSNYRYLKHGEAVGWGILFASELSKRLELLPQSELNLLYDVVHRFDPLPDISHIPLNDIIESLAHDKKSDSGDVQWILLNGIGQPMIFQGKDISKKLLIGAHKAILKSRSLRT